MTQEDKKLFLESFLRLCTAYNVVSVETASKDIKHQYIKGFTFEDGSSISAFELVEYIT